MCLIKLILWLLTALCVAAGLTLQGTLTSILFFLAAFLIMPLPRLRKFIEKFIGTALRIVLIVAMILLALAMAPQIRDYVMGLIG